MESSSIVSSEKGLRKGAWAEEEDLLLRKCIMMYGEGKWRQVPIRAGLNRCRKSCRLRWLNYLQPNIKRGEFKADEVDLIVKMHKLLGNRWSLIAGRLPGRTANDIKNYYNTHLKKTCFSKYITEKGQQVPVTKKSDNDNNVHQDGQEHEHRQILKRRRPCPKISTIDDIGDKHMTTHVLKPQPRTLKKYQWNMNKVTTPIEMNNNNITTTTSTIFPNNAQVFNKNITNGLPSLVGNHHEKFSNVQQSHDNSSDWLKSILFGETEEEEDSVPKKKKKPKKKKRVTPNNNNNASLIESNITKGVEEGMTKHTNDGNDDQHAYCSFGVDKGLEEGGNSGDHGNFWNSYLDDNLWRMLGEEQEQYLI